MPNFIDRRLNPKDKSLSNRQRFLRRARAQLKSVINQSVKDRGIVDLGGRQVVSVPTKGIGEPRFHNSSKGGKRDQVFTGNRGGRGFVTGQGLSSLCLVLGVAG